MESDGGRSERLTNQMLYQLSYASLATRAARVLERETGIEPATNSLEGCDSTIELLPLVFVFSNFHCGLLRSFAANGAQWRQFAQSLHKAGAPLHKCTKSPPGPRYASCREPPS